MRLANARDLGLYVRDRRRYLGMTQAVLGASAHVSRRWLSGRRAGVVTMGATGRFSLTYDEAWREARTATPLSLSMPLAQRQHSDTPVRAFLWGLLPDNERVLERWAQDYQVSSGNPAAWGSPLPAAG